MTYLTKATGSGHADSVLHIWDGKDTLCQMWSKGIAKAKSSKHYKLTDGANGKEICINCLNIKQSKPDSTKTSNDVVITLPTFQNDIDKAFYIIDLLKSKLSWRKLKQNGDESVRKLIAEQERSAPLLINPDASSDAFYVGCEKLLNEIREILSKR